MNIFHQELQKKFGKIYIPKLFNIFITIDYSYLRELNEKNRDFVVVRVKYDTNIGIVGYTLLDNADILNPTDKIQSYFTIIYKDSPDIILLDKSEVIFLPVKKYLRKLKIKKLHE